MRKLFLASLLGATVVSATGCDGLSKFLTTPTNTNKPGTTTAEPTPGPQIDLQAQLQQAAGFSSNLQQAAGFGVVLNGPTSQLQQAAGLQQPGSTTYRISSTGINMTYGQPFRGEIGSGDLVASGSITGTATTSINNQEFLKAFTFDLEIATASQVPSLQGWKITGNLEAVIDTATQGLKGVLTLASGSVSVPVDFTFALKGTNGAKWILTSPVTIDGVQHYSHLEVDALTHSGTGWVAKDKTGTTDNRVANCSSTNGKWTVKLLANPDATSSITMPWSL